MSSIKVRIPENIGIVAGEASLTQFKFFLTPLKGIVNRQGDYVLLNHPTFGRQCQVLAMLRDIENFEEVVGATLGEKSVKTMGVGQVLGYIDLKEVEKGVMPIRPMAVPVRPGARVFLPYHHFIQTIFSRNLDGSPFVNTVHLGIHSLSATDEKGEVRTINFCLNAADVCGQHTLITSMTGLGKTHTAAIIAEELVNKHDRPVIIFDPHGEYRTIGIADQGLKELAEQNKGSSEEYPFNGEVSIYAHDCEEASSTLKSHGIEPGEEVRFSLKPYEELAVEDFRQRRVTVFDMKGLSTKSRASIFTDCMISLFEARVRRRIPPFFVIVEEAGNLACSNEAATLLRRISSEGVKNGVSMCLLCQHPAELDDKVLSQTGMQIMGRIVDPKDLERLRYMAHEQVTRLSNLGLGEWLINGISLLRPMMIQVRDRYSPRA